MTVAVEEFLRRIPEFSLAGEVTWSGGYRARSPSSARQLPTRASSSGLSAATVVTAGRLGAGGGPQRRHALVEPHPHTPPRAAR